MPNLQSGGMPSSNLASKNSKSPMGGLDQIGSQIIGEHRRNTQEDVSNFNSDSLTMILTLYSYRWTPLCLQLVSIKVVFRMRVRAEPQLKNFNRTSSSSVIQNTSSITNKLRCCNNKWRLKSWHQPVTAVVIWCTETAWQDQDVKDIMSHSKKWNKS